MGIVIPVMTVLLTNIFKWIARPTPAGIADLELSFDLLLGAFGTQLSYLATYSTLPASQLDPTVQQKADLGNLVLILIAILGVLIAFSMKQWGYTSSTSSPPTPPSLNAFGLLFPNFLGILACAAVYIANVYGATLF